MTPKQIAQIIREWHTADPSAREFRIGRLTIRTDDPLRTAMRYEKHRASPCGLPRPVAPLSPAQLFRQFVEDGEEANALALAELHGLPVVRGTGGNLLTDVQPEPHFPEFVTGRLGRHWLAIHAPTGLSAGDAQTSRALAVAAFKKYTHEQIAAALARNGYPTNGS